MHRIYRFTLTTADRQTVALPEGARVLSVAPAAGHDETPAIDLWALVDPDGRREARTFLILGSGDPVPDEAVTFIGTVPEFRGQVLHVFEATP